MLKLIINLFVLCSFISVIQAQSAEKEIVKAAFRDFSANSYSAIMSDRFAKNKGYEKSNMKAVLLFPNYQDATVYFYEGNAVTSKLNYFIEDDGFIFEKDGQLLKLNSSEIEKVVFSHKTFYNVKYKHKKKLKTHFFEVLHESNKLILLKMIKIIAKRKTQGPLRQANEIEIKKEKSIELYYLLSGKKYAKKVPKRIKNMKPIFGNKYDMVLKYVKENHLKIRKEHDLVQVLDHFYENN